MDVYANFLYLMWIICSWGYSLGFFQWDTSYSETVACVGKDANLEWKYTSNETISALLWEKVGSPDISIASYFGVTFTASSAYAGRINQTQPGSASVTLTSVTSSDNGTYRCTVQSTHMDLIDLIVAETPSGLPILNKTADTLICIPPQNGGTPNVETILKKNDGTILNTLTVQSPGTYHCCIRGSAVRCLGSTSNTATEVCVNETINLETTTAATTSQTTTELVTTSTESLTTTQPETTSTDSVSTTSKSVTTSTESLTTTQSETTSTDSVSTTSKSETTTKSYTGSIVTEDGDLTTNQPTTTHVADGSPVMTTVGHTSNTKLSGLSRDEIIAIGSIVGFFIILFIVAIVTYVVYTRIRNNKNTKDERENQAHYHKHQGQMKRHEYRFNDYNTRGYLYSEGFNIKQEKGERYIAQEGDPNKRQKMMTTRSYRTYQQPRGHDYNHYKSANTVSTYYPRMYGESHNYGFDIEMSPYIESFQYYTGSTHGSTHGSYYNHQNPERSGGRHHGRYQERQGRPYPATSNYYYPNGQYYY